MNSVMPWGQKRQEKMSNIEDKYDKQEPEPEERFFDTKQEPELEEQFFDTTPPEEKPEEIAPLTLDTSLNQHVPYMLDAYEGPSHLRFSRGNLPIDPNRPYFPRTGKKPYQDVRYKGEYHPPQHPIEVEILPKDPVPNTEKCPPPIETPVPTARKQRSVKHRSFPIDPLEPQEHPKPPEPPNQPPELEKQTR